MSVRTEQDSVDAETGPVAIHRTILRAAMEASRKLASALQVAPPGKSMPRVVVGIAIILTACLLTGGVIEVVYDLRHEEMVFLPAVMIVSFTLGFRWGAVTAVICLLLTDTFLIKDPSGRSVTDLWYLSELFAFLVVSGIATLMGARVRQSEQAARRAASEIEIARAYSQSERLRHALLQSVSHDLKTPLATVIGAISSILRFGDRLDIRTRDDMLKSSLNEAEHMARLVSNMLDMTKLDSGALQPKIGAADLSDIVSGVLERIERQAYAHRFDLDIPDHLPMARCDSVLLDHALFNILDNAAKYAPESTTVTISGREDGRRVLLTISDEGPGITAANLPLIFDKFYRADVEQRRVPGTGLGLAVARGFVEAMGGTLRAGNRADRRGAEFTIALEAAEPIPQMGA